MFLMVTEEFSSVVYKLLFQTQDKVESHLGKVLGAVQFRDVWTDTAEVLIRQV